MYKSKQLGNFIDVENSDQYLLFGEETTNEVTQFVLLQLKVDQEAQKIDAIKIYYVQSAYYNKNEHSYLLYAEKIEKNRLFF